MEDSLINRLAGPSTGKAGLSADQADINRVIAEASKGSKFFDNEKRKDEELTEKIKRLLKERDDAMKGVDTTKVEAAIDGTLIEFENRRDLSQYIVHVDMDAFFAAVEVLDNPKLKGRPFGVGFSVLTTASYDARLFGVRSGMPGFIAKKLCPHIKLVPIRPGRYSEMSERVMNVFRRYDINMQPGGLEEAYLNVTKYCQDTGISPDECIAKLRAEVFQETELTVSAGIAPNKMLAKICSDKNKPNGQFHLSFNRESILDFMRVLPIRKIPGIGRVTERLLGSIGIKTCGDIYKHRATLSLLDKQFHLQSLLSTYLGISSNVVQPTQRSERKSLGSERTFNPISDSKQIFAKLADCAEELEAEMKQGEWAGRTVTLKYKLDTFQVFTRAKSSSKFITSKEGLYAIGKSLLVPEFPLTIRLIGLRITKLKDLRSNEGQGLKRYFESTSSSPTKKRQKIDHSLNNEEGKLEASQRRLEEEQAMAEYEDDDERVMFDDESNANTEETAFPSKKPISKSSSSNQSPHITESKAASSKVKISSRGETGLQCPICSRILNTDNAGLNEHIDFCLSKGTIMAATAV